MKTITNEKGIALIMAIFMLVIFSVLGLAVITMTNQGQKQRDLSNEQIEGKMLADTGLLYFQQYLDAYLKKYSPTNTAYITTGINNIASQVSYKTTKLNDGSNGSFKIMYEDLSTIPYQDDSSGPSQPYIRKLKVSVIGIPGDTSHFKSVKLTAIVYINTIASPFHYAVSTPSELYLYGGSNIIGNVIANKFYVSTQHYLSNYDEGQDKYIYSIDPNPDPVDTPYVNLPYIEGKVFLNGDSPILYKVSSIPLDGDQRPLDGNDQPSPLDDSVLTEVHTDRQSLQGLFSPKHDGSVSALPDTPYIPGSEPPLVEKLSGTTNQRLTFTSSNSYLKQYIQSSFKDIASRKSADKTLDSSTSPIWIGAANDVDLTGFDPSCPSVRDTVIYTNQNNLLSVRLTGDVLQSTQRLFIGPDPDPNKINPDADVSTDRTYYGSMNASVEMGTSKSFEPSSTANKPFSFYGTIFIKGNLDIVGDIHVNGTIYVDGDVNIRENNGASITDKPNLVILSTKKITISKKIPDQLDEQEQEREKDPKNAHPLSAFLYSDSQPIEIYSHDSVNWFYGGLATGSENTSDTSGNIELDTKREDQNSNRTPYASHMTIQFNRGIFENPTPGLPSEPSIVDEQGDINTRYHFDTYDIQYKLDDDN